MQIICWTPFLMLLLLVLSNDYKNIVLWCVEAVNSLCGSESASASVCRGTGHNTNTCVIKPLILKVLVCVVGYYYIAW